MKMLANSVVTRHPFLRPRPAAPAGGGAALAANMDLLFQNFTKNEIFISILFKIGTLEYIFGLSLIKTTLK